MKYFYLSHATTLLGLAAAYWWAGWGGLGVAALLMLMEITLSFDNAVVNATVLRDMNTLWRQRFMTWGMLIAVFGMRLIFPLLIVALATGLSMLDVSKLALENPRQYSEHVLSAHTAIVSFGGMFLLMVFLHFIFDETKELHWLGALERKLGALGKLEAVEVILALCVLLALQAALPQGERLSALTAGVIGVVLYVSVNSMTALLSQAETRAVQNSTAGAAASSGFMAFIYLQILDASFSLDGVIGAFAISLDVVIIMIGLGIGAMFVRSLTLYMVEKGTLDRYVFLEHGAHYGIGALAVIMLVSMTTPVSEFITGFVGMLFLGLSLWSSVRYNRTRQP